MPRLTIEANDALRKQVWGEFRLPRAEALDRLRASPLTRQEIADLIAQASSTPGGAGASAGGGAGGEYPEGYPTEPPLRDRLVVINSETFVVSLTGNTAGEFRGVACTSVLPHPAVITQLVLRIHNVQDAVTWMATLVPNDISDSNPGDITGIPLFDARFPNLGGILGTYPILGGTLTANAAHPTTVDTHRLVEQPGMRVALWMETGVITWRATLYVTVGVFDPSVTAADIIKATLPRRKAWQYDKSEVVATAERAEAARLAEAEEARRQAAATTAAAAATAPPPPIYRQPAPRTTKTITIQQSPYPRAILTRVLQGGRVLTEREIPWTSLSPALKQYWIRNQEAGRDDPTMIPIW